MSSFTYVAVRGDGATVRGQIDAPSDGAVSTRLSQRGLYAVVVEPVRAVPVPFWRRPSVQSQAMLFRALASMVGAGIVLDDALDATRRITTGPLGEALARVREQVCQGQELATALEAEPGVFAPVAVGLVRAGEGGVGLASGLEAAARELERVAETTASVRAAIAYPAVLLLVGGLSLLVILFVVVPRFAEVLTDVRAALPLGTRVLLAMSATVRGHLAFVALGAGATLALPTVIWRRRREVWDEWLLTAPLVGPVRHGLATVRVARVMASLMNAGGSALAGLRIAEDAVGDTAVARRLAAAREHVAQGMTLSRALAQEDALTPLALRLATVGDGTGQMASLLARAADVEEALAQRRVRTAVSLVEPVLIVALAGVVAFVALSLLQAVYSMRPAGF